MIFLEGWGQNHTSTVGSLWWRAMKSFRKISVDTISLITVDF